MKIRMKVDDASTKAHVEERARINDEVKASSTGHRII